MATEDLWLMMRCLFIAAAVDVVALVFLFAGLMLGASAVEWLATALVWGSTVFVLYGAFVPAIRRAQGRRMGGE